MLKWNYNQLKFNFVKIYKIWFKVLITFDQKLLSIKYVVQKVENLILNRYLKELLIQVYWFSSNL